MNNKPEKRLKIMGGLIVMVKSMTGVMLVSIILGLLGNLSAIAIPTLGGLLLLNALDQPVDLFWWTSQFSVVATLIIVVALLRGGLRYGEQVLGHYIAFRVLAIIRGKIFRQLRRLSPAKLEGKKKGDLISMITSDIELLEVFYAHTIAPITIAVLTIIIMSGILFSVNVVVGFIALAAYLIVGTLLPTVHSIKGAKEGGQFREEIGRLNGHFLESLRGLRESLQFGQREKRTEQVKEKTQKLNDYKKEMYKKEGKSAGFSTAMVLLAALGVFLFSVNAQLPFEKTLMGTILIASSFGPVLALANLSGTLSQTLASGDRVLSLLAETPETIDVTQGKEVEFEDIEAENVDFSYGETKILSQVDFKAHKGEIVAITGPSGRGKTTLLKLLMRFWDVKGGEVRVSQENIQNINTTHLRNLESYMTQDTDLFNQSIKENISLGKEDATMEEIIECAKKASIHDFIETLPKGYDTRVGELGEMLSGGEKQRIGLARAFLHQGEIMVLDEPTSNLDALNEGKILHAIKKEKGEKTVVLVSHRKSTAALAGKHYQL